MLQFPVVLHGFWLLWGLPKMGMKNLCHHSKVLYARWTFPLSPKKSGNTFKPYVTWYHKLIDPPSAQPVPMWSTFGRVWHSQVWIQWHFRVFPKISLPFIICFNASLGKIASKISQPLANWKIRFPLICPIVILPLGGMDNAQQKSHSLWTLTLTDSLQRSQEPPCSIAKIMKSTIMSEFLMETGVISGNASY